MISRELTPELIEDLLMAVERSVYASFAVLFIYFFWGGEEVLTSLKARVVYPSQPTYRPFFLFVKFLVCISYHLGFWWAGIAQSV